MNCGSRIADFGLAPRTARRPGARWAGSAKRGSSRGRGVPATPPSARGSLVSLLVLVLIGPAIADDPKSPLPVPRALSEFRVHPEFRIELAAAEPQVVDPVAVRFDADGRMWVVEMGDYPNGPKKGEQPLSRVRWLEDTDGDGRFETSRVFADGLLYATGLQPWKNGVLVTVAGAVLFLEDTDGDGRADQSETWYTGFKEENPQLRANHPTFALDNRIYVANGLRGGVVKARRPIAGGKTEPVSISGRDFAFDPRSGTYEAVNGNGQFGMTFDDFGNRFVCSNRNPCRHVVLESRYLAGNAHLAVSAVMHDVSTPGAASRVFPISRTWTTSTLHEGQFTAACGVTIYRGDLFDKAFAGNAFICEPTGNLVHRDVLSPRGATFTARAGREGVEFLASRDEWFRPVSLEVGPDGALYVVDMYRAVIEHPQWVPDELKRRPDNYHGNDRGRIWRIVPKDHITAGRERTSPQLSEVAPAALVPLLAHRNAWHREAAARLIHESGDRSIVGALETMVAKSDSRLGRIHALWALEGLQSVSRDLLKRVLADSDPRVVGQALVLLESHLASAPELFRALDSFPDEDQRLRFQYIMTSSRHPGWRQDGFPFLPTMLATLARHGPPFDRWTRLATANAAGAQPARVLGSLLAMKEKSTRPPGDAVRELVRMLCEVVGARDSGDEVAQVIRDLAIETSSAGQRVKWAGMAGLDRGLRRRGASLSRRRGGDSRKLDEALDAIWLVAARRAADRRWPVGGRLDALAVFGSAPEATSRPVLLRLATSNDDREIRLAALDRLGRLGGDEIGQALLEDFSSLSPALRRGVLDVLLSDPRRCGLLLDAVAANRVGRADLDPRRVKRLLEHKNEGVRTRAGALLAELIPADRKQVLADYQPALSRTGDARAGREVFRKHCAACHRVDRIGVDVAPDIADSRTKSPAQLLTSILDPNRAVDNNYFSYTLVTTGGRVHTGVIASETPTTITLRQAEGKQVSVLRSEIEELKSNAISLMPVGLEKNIPVTAMADLLSFLKNWRYLDGRVPVKK